MNQKSSLPQLSRLVSRVLTADNWLLDAIVSHQHDARVRSEPFQVWTLKVADDRTAVLTCEDGDHGVVTSQAIAFTDFPLPEITLWLQNDVIFLPSEY